MPETVTEEKVALTDAACNTVFIVQALERYPDVMGRMVSALLKAGIDVRFIGGTKNVWIRDWAPVQTPSGFVKFVYKGDSLIKKWPQLRVEDHCWKNDFPDAFRSDIILDGGNIVRHGDKVLMTEIVFEHNPCYDRDELAHALKVLLKAQIIFLPVEPGDELGHADGVCTWIDTSTVFLNNYRLTHVPELVDYERAVRNVLSATGIEAEPFPFSYQSSIMSETLFRAKFPHADAYCPARGYWINMLHVNELVLYPEFGLAGDNSVRNILDKTFRGDTCTGINCDDLSWEGGLLRCVSWQGVM